jgi:hypothetical protein
VSTKPGEVQLPDKGNIYYSGHWGWQWYAEQNGMKQLEALNPRIKPGDYLVYPEKIHQKTLVNIPPRLHLKVVREYNEPISTLTFYKTDDERFYSSDMNKLAWVANWRPFTPIRYIG